MNYCSVEKCNSVLVEMLPTHSAGEEMSTDEERNSFLDKHRSNCVSV